MTGYPIYPSTKQFRCFFAWASISANSTGALKRANRLSRACAKTRRACPQTNPSTHRPSRDFTSSIQSPGPNHLSQPRWRPTKDDETVTLHHCPVTRTAIVQLYDRARLWPNQPRSDLRVHGSSGLPTGSVCRRPSRRGPTDLRAFVSLRCVSPSLGFQLQRGRTESTYAALERATCLPVVSR